MSGDGVDQDDYVTEAGLRGYEAAVFLRADRTEIRGVTLPYLKFPRAPEEERAVLVLDIEADIQHRGGR